MVFVRWSSLMATNPVPLHSSWSYGTSKRLKIIAYIVISGILAVLLSSVFYQAAALSQIGTNVRQIPPTSVPFPPPDIIRLAVTLLIVIPALIVILDKRYSRNEKHWAYGIVGTILGYWLHR
jgi:hypothetical protein